MPYGRFITLSRYTNLRAPDWALIFVASKIRFAAKFGLHLQSNGNIMKAIKRIPLTNGEQRTGDQAGDHFVSPVIEMKS